MHSTKPSSPSLYICALIALAGSVFCSNAKAATACIWRVMNVPVPFYLVGTIHALSGNDYPLPKAYDQVLHDSQRLLFELAPNPTEWSDRFTATGRLQNRAVVARV